MGNNKYTTGKKMAKNSGATATPNGVVEKSMPFIGGKSKGQSGMAIAFQVAKRACRYGGLTTSVCIFWYLSIDNGAVTL